MTPVYQYRASLVRVIDGDTYLLSVDLGFRVRAEIRVRLFGIDTPELQGDTLPAGLAAKQYAESALRAAEEIIVVTHKTRGESVVSFDRWVAEVWVDGLRLADLLRSAGYAR